MRKPKLSELKLDSKGTIRLRKIMDNSNKKVKITINFDSDILEEVKNLALLKGCPYQSLLNKLVRESLNVKKNNLSRLDRIENEILMLKSKFLNAGQF